MAHLPEEVGQADEEREADAGIEPGAFQKVPRARKHNAGKDSSDVKNDGVFGEQPHTDRRADGDPPARVLRAKQANREVRNQHPP